MYNILEAIHVVPAKRKIADNYRALDPAACRPRCEQISRAGHAPFCLASRQKQPVSVRASTVWQKM